MRALLACELLCVELDNSTLVTLKVHAIALSVQALCVFYIRNSVQCP